MSSKVTKAIKLFFHKPLNSTWEELGRRLRDLQYEQAKILNYGMTRFWFWQEEKEKYKTVNGRYPKNIELSHPAYDNTQPVKIFIKENFPNVPSGTVSSIAMFLQGRWSADCKEAFYRFDKSLSTFKKSFPILCSNTQYKIERKDDKDILIVTLASKHFDGISRFEIELKTLKFNNGERVILDRILSGRYKKGQLKLACKKDKNWFATIAYNFEPEEKKLNQDIICGVDLGVVNAFYAAITNSYNRLQSYDSMEIYGFRRQIDKRRKEYQRQAQVSTRGGSGRKKILKPIAKLQEKVINFRDNKYHVYTKNIIDFCVKNQAGTLQIKDYSSLALSKQDNFFLKDWALNSLFEKLEYKAAEAGIKIVKVSPQYTSQRCFKCGYINSENRKTQSEFLCVECGYKAHADYNAAQNLTIYGIDEIIQQTLETQKKIKKDILEI